MSARTSIKKDRRAQLEAIERAYHQMVADLQELADKPGSTKAFVSRPHGLEVSIKNDGTVTDWNA